jgi:hypothetical protein
VVRHGLLIISLFVVSASGKHHAWSVVVVAILSSPFICCHEVALWLKTLSLVLFALVYGCMASIPASQRQTIFKQMLVSGPAACVGGWLSAR